MLDKTLDVMWSITPKPLKPIIGGFPLSKFACGFLLFGGKSYYSHFNLLKDMQFWSPERVAEYQFNELKKIIQHAYENVPYYRSSFKKNEITPSSIKSFDDLEKIPIISKKDILKNPKSFLSKKNRPAITRLTGGSNGEPLKVHYDLNHYGCRRATTRFFKHLAGYDDYGSVRLCIPGWGPFYKREKGFYEFNPITKQLFVSASNLSDETFNRYLDLIKKFKPKYLEGHPSTIYRFALFLKDKGIFDVNFKIVQTSGELIYPFQRKIISKVFDCEVYDFYGNEEGLCFASECNKHKGWHNASLGYVEIVKNDKNIGKGNMGEIVATGLCDSYMPLIRYNLKDLGMLAKKPCSCGRGFPVLDAIVGRANDSIILPDNSIIPPNYFTTVMEDFDFADEFQIIQEKKDHLLIKIVKTKSEFKKESDNLLNNLKNLTKNQMKINLEFVDYIGPVGNKNKYKYIISKVDY